MNKINPQPAAALLFAGGILDSKLNFGLCALAFVAVFLANREVRKAFWAPTRPPEGNATAAPAMRSWRLLAAYAVGALILGGSFFDLVNDTEHWPFSQYAMFSFLDTPTDGKFTLLRLYGVTQRQPLSEFPLDKNEYLEPFDLSRGPAALDRARTEHRLTAALEDCLRRYDALRVSGIHHGPALQAMRLYRVTWTLDSQARNVNSPDHKELLGEVSEPGSSGQ